MKTTDYNTSVKLKELGFKAEHSTGHIINEADEELIKKHGISIVSEFYPAYDLETILDALPNYIYSSVIVSDYNFEKDIHNKFWLRIYNKDRISYENQNDVIYFQEYFKENESLATTAGRLLVKLIEEGLIKLEVVK